MIAMDRHARRGFTLIELMMVILLIALIASVAAPRLLPLLTITEHENEARRLVGYGRTAMAHAALTRKPIRVRIDLDRQEYWSEEMPMLIPEPDESSTQGSRYDDDEDDDIPDDDYELEQTTKRIIRSQDENRESDTVDELDPRYRDEETRKSVLDKQRETMEERFQSMADNSLYARALRVNHEGRQFGLEELYEDAEFDDEELEGKNMPKPISDILLKAHQVIETVWIDTVWVGEDEFQKGIVDIDLTPLGLETDVAFALFNEEGDLLMVYWDPLSGNAWYTREASDS